MNEFLRYFSSFFFTNFNVFVNIIFIIFSWCELVHMSILYIL